MQVSDTPEGPATPMLHPPVQIPVRLIQSAAPTDSTAVRALFDSILQWGILQPLIVRRIAGSTRYEVLAGCKRFASAVSAGFSQVPCVVFEGSDAEAAAVTAASNISAAIAPASPATAGPVPFVGLVLSELQATRSAIAASLQLGQSNAAGLRPRIARQLVDIDLQRASWLMDGLQILTSEERVSRTSVRLAPVLRSVVEAFEPECRLAMIHVQLLVEPPDLTAAADEAEFRAAINCALGAVLTSIHASQNAEGALSILVNATSAAVLISIEQNVVPFQELARVRSIPRRGDAAHGAAPSLTSFGLESARRVVERYGGRLELRPAPATGGAILDLKLPPVSRRGLP
jgi:hypothetical protein